MIWIPLLLMSASFAQDRLTERYCFPGPSQMQKAVRLTQGILVPSDELTTDGSCFLIHMNAHRRELIQSFVHRIAPEMSISFSSAMTNNSACKLKIEKVKTYLKQTNGAEFQGQLNVESTTREESSSEINQVQTTKDFEMTLNQETIKGSCQFISPTKYNITLKIIKSATPLIQDQISSEQNLLTLQTELQLEYGSRIEIGGIVRDLKKKDHHIDVSGTQFENSENTGQEKVYLSLE